ncbi:MAG TPA: SRPBCC domain-containing protein [Bryobacteraceae bacterium]|nr:SRPBCC domain-containing protein [Bryobacteraceae bacterium]
MTDRVRVSVTVPADPATAFALFTEETDLWWRRGPRFRASGRTPGVLSFSPGVGGALSETFEAADGPRTVVTGTITHWEPPDHFRFEWRAINFAPGESTTVDVRFEATQGGTRVTVEHSGWSSLRADHPVRHGKDTGAFLRTMGLWWGELLTSLRERA